MYFTAAEAREFLRKVQGSPRIAYVGEEKEQLLVMLRLVGPFKEYNDQRLWTTEYHLGERVFRHTTGYDGAEIDIFEEILPDDF
jgi:hypothetical protein